jgi:hypothetical protein
MALSTDTCSLCAKPFYGKQKSIKCCGPCDSRYHLSCVHISDTEYQYYTNSGDSTYKCATCVKILCLQRSDDTPVKARSSSTSDLPKVISPERSLVLPPVMDTDKVLCLQRETVRLNGTCALDLIQSLIAAVNKLSDDVTQPERYRCRISRA